MNQILTDILGLLKRKKVVTNAKDTSLIPLSGKKTGSLGLSGPNPSEDITLITAKDFATNYIAPNVQPTTSNTVYGLNAFQNNTSGINNTAIGETALRDNTTGNANIAVGVGASQRSTTGIENTAIGFLSFLFNDSGSRNTSLGAYTGYNSRTGDNTYIGYRSGQESWNGGSNTAVGSEAHKSVWNSTAANNVAIGKNALLVVNSDDNVAVGYNSLQNNTTGYSNTAVGFNSLSGNSSGGGNVAVGGNALESNYTGQNNTAIGQYAMAAAYEGNSNIAIGNNAAYDLYAGSFNVVIANEEYSLQDGNGNVAIGHLVDTGNNSHSVILGREAAATASNQFVVGSSSYDAGAVATETNTSSKVWNVVINGVEQKILLA